MSEESRVRVTDKRGKPKDGGGRAEPAPLQPDAVVPGETARDAEGAEVQDYLADLQRLQADFDNYKKRQIRERTELIERAAEHLVADMLPVLDHFDRALEHLDDTGISMVHAELRKALENHGLSEIEAEGRPFDPNFHEAVESHEDAEASEPTVTKVYRRGYMLGKKVLRPPMVVVARPPEEVTEETPDPAAAEG